MAIDVTTFVVYKWRYYIGYGLITLLAIGLLVFAGLFAPGGISSAEEAAVVKSATISIVDINSFAVTNLPFHLLQQASISLFGVSDFSIKLPSLILGLISAIGLILLLRQWFKPNIAVLASIIAVTTGQFVFIAQSGTPGILYVFWSVWILLLGTLIAKKAKPPLLWNTLFFVVAALSLYTPLSIYALLALGIAAFLHPHLRHIVRTLPKKHIALGMVLAAIIVAPLIYGIVLNPRLGLDILGIPTAMPDLIANLKLLANQYLGFMFSSTTGLMTPVFGLGSLLIIGFGVYKLIQTRESTQSYLIMTWLLCLIPVLLINPLFTSVTFLPLVLLLATGLSSLLGYWYRLFPFNPYARTAGLIPLVILVGALVFSGLERYIYGYQYDPGTVANFSRDLSLLPDDTKQLVVADSELSFYTIVAQHHSELSVVSRPSDATFTATHAANTPQPGYQIISIVTDKSSDNSDRYYVYKKTTP